MYIHNVKKRTELFGRTNADKYAQRDDQYITISILIIDYRCTNYF